jgi:ubiquinone biosynthesis protein
VISPGLSVASAAVDLGGSDQERPIVDMETMIRDELLAMLPRLRRLPDRFDRIMTLAARGDLRVRNVADEGNGRVLRTFVNRGLLAAIGAAFLLGATVLLASANKGPSVSDGTGLFEILGYGGLLAGTVLMLRVVAAVARDGTT